MNSSQDSDAQRFAQAAALAQAACGAAVHYAGHYRYGPSFVAARFRLANGLTVLVMPDARAPVFAYQTWFRVGSKHEDPGRTGLAHLFEHLMFKGTKLHPPGEFDRELEKRGSQTNAATWVDWTHYTEALASRADNLATVVHFEADRMQHLELEAERFESELEVVKNERRMSVDDSVGGRINEELFGAAFKCHGYGWPTIGRMAHLETMTREHAQRFYETYYAPNNATVVVAGDVDVQEVLTLIGRAYGPIPASTIPTYRPVVEPRQTARRNVRLQLRTVATHVVVAFRAPAQDHPSYAALELLGEPLLVGDNARLFKRLVTQEELCADVEGFLTPFSESGLWELTAVLRPGADPARVVAIIDEELALITREGLTPGEWIKARNGLELLALEGLKDVEGLAELLGHYETNFGDFSLGFRAMERWRNLGPADLEAAAREVFRPENATVVVVEPSEASQ